MKLNDQREEIINGERHMVKCAERHSKTTHNCSGCFYNDHMGKCLYGQDCPIADVEHGYIKDLGILNEKGLLPEERTGEYPSITKINRIDGSTAYQVFYSKSFLSLHVSTGFYPTLQEAKDAWNRRY